MLAVTGIGCVLSSLQCARGLHQKLGAELLSGFCLVDTLYSG